jgi:ribosomal protein L11 methylase PrmA
VSLHSLRGLLDSLRTAVEKLEWKPQMGVWGDYYNDTNYSDDSFAHKREIVESYIRAAGPSVVWDLGANNGLFSRLAAGAGADVVSMDVEPAAVEANYRRCRNENEQRILPLLMDLTNPSPGLGWAGEERQGLMKRGNADVVLALALVHHLAIGNNVPLVEVARLFGRLSRKLIIEFVPKEDSQVQRMLATREDIFSSYTERDFEKAFEEVFEIDSAALVRGSCRRIYSMTLKRSSRD